MLNSHMDSRASTVASVTFGITERRKHAAPTRRILLVSKPSPARVRMTTRAPLRSAEDQLESTSLPMSIPGTFLSTNPVCVGHGRAW